MELCFPFFMPRKVIIFHSEQCDCHAGEEKRLTWFAGEEADDGVLAGRCYSPLQFFLCSSFSLVFAFCVFVFLLPLSSLLFFMFLSRSVSLFFSSVFRSVSCASCSFYFVRCLSCVLRCSLCILLVSLCSSSLNALFLVQ